MITYKQITKASDIASLSDYYVLDVRTTGPNPSLNAISSVSMLQIEDDLVMQEAVVRIASVKAAHHSAGERIQIHDGQTQDLLLGYLSGLIL